ncbi:hypothetical protein GCM10023340_12480 [Nocardioides marinquilinus]|uniref:DUF4232 domain-containing protein n=1 Tax=Nocardioides marinquilinus TaxID=1210400 RepID=A0ABP9PGL0_9ACTN
MRFTTTSRVLAAGVLVVGIGLGVSACGDDDPAATAGGEPAPTTSASPSTAPAAPTEPSASASSATPASPSPTASAPVEPVVPECTASDVRASFAHLDSGAGSRIGSLAVLNTSGAPCFVQGYGGLSYVGEGDGQQVGAAADRDPGTPVTRIVLPPDGVASSEVREASTGAYDEGGCGATEVDGFRLYLPDETHALFVRHRTDVCTNADVHLLSHQAFAAG